MECFTVKTAKKMGHERTAAAYYADCVTHSSVLALGQVVINVQHFR